MRLLFPIFVHIYHINSLQNYCEIRIIQLVCDLLKIKHCNEIFMPFVNQVSFLGLPDDLLDRISGGPLRQKSCTPG